MLNGTVKRMRCNATDRLSPARIAQLFPQSIRGTRTVYIDLLSIGFRGDELVGLGSAVGSITTLVAALIGGFCVRQEKARHPNIETNLQNDNAPPFYKIIVYGYLTLFCTTRQINQGRVCKHSQFFK